MSATQPDLSIAMIDAEVRETDIGVVSRPLRLQVYERIEQMIMQGKLQPREKLVEADLARLLKVSRGPVREALQLLERDGWVEVRPRHGAVVRRRTESEIAELFDVRKTLEIRGAQLAAMNINDMGRERLTALLREADLAEQTGDVHRLIAANVAVHHLIPELSGSRTLVDLVRTISRRIRWYTLTPVTQTRAPAVRREHQAIADAVMAGDHVRAAELTADHHDLIWSAYKAWLQPNAY